MPLILLPFLGSGFVPTDSMPTALRWFAEYQPFTPFIETLRGLLMGTPIGNSAILAVALVRGHHAGRIPVVAGAVRPRSRAVGGLHGAVVTLGPPRLAQAEPHISTLDER